ncbi:MAG: nickel pincer cofactor biosynthesis protein LarB [Acidobacteria bacterium]|nr:nickel pincer cofactor biosynthesis protein LarB [Acidobacteriota bacterium]
MDATDLRKLLESVAGGGTDVEAALDRLRHLPFEDIGCARVDHHRSLRNGFPEVIFGRGKSAEQVEAIAGRILDRSANLLVTHAGPGVYERLTARFTGLEYHPDSRCITRQTDFTDYGEGVVLVITAGTADIPVAEEARLTAKIMGNRVDFVTDVGVAGIHRLLDVRDKIFGARAIVAVAGMEGALPSVVGGLASCPVIAVPTSVGYGASFGGVAALLGMLNSCASNVVVVNIDNGFGAGYTAALINRRRAV